MVPFSYIISIFFIHSKYLIYTCETPNYTVNCPQLIYDVFEFQLLNLLLVLDFVS